jgi:hypothetical protein
MRGLLSDVAKEVARAKTLPPVSRASPGARTRKRTRRLKVGH